MRVINEELLASLRTPGPCGCCRRYSRRREPHHALGRGMGGGRRIDIAENLLPLGNSFECQCHNKFQANKDGYSRLDASRLIGKRLGKTGEECIAEVDRIRAL